MAQLRHNAAQFDQRNTEIVVVGPEDENSFADYFEEHDLPFRGYPDPDHTVLKLYGQEVNLFRLGRMPAQVLIDKEGIARFVHYGKSMADIPSTEEIIALIDRLDLDKGNDQFEQGAPALSA